MSLPPLVCNTPPPPDQCEDDKDPEDFDMNYNLSQDDDEDSNSYDYQTYSNYNMYDTNKPVNIEDSAWSINIANNLNSVLTEQISTVEDKKTEHITPIINDLNDKLTLEDVAVEDLNLEISQEQLNPQIINENSDADSSDYNYSPDEKVSGEKSITNCDIVETDIVIIQSDNICTTETPENSSANDVEDSEQMSKTYDLRDDEFNDFHSNLDAKSKEAEVQIQSENELNIENEIENLEGNVAVDDFGDFDEFQFANNDNVSTVVENVENPWTNETPSNDFGDFKANFDDNHEVLHVDDKNLDVINDHKDICVTNEINDDGDDFGDFDDFKSCTKSAVKDDSDTQIDQHVPVIDFHSSENENQVLESINNIFSTIFEEEISEPESEFIGRLESVLNETWGHLVDTDVRQPYMVNWNNSLGQKSLLKALCIDSRNILFGPKWNYNMPKYAVNLSAAPLQPQKQVSTLPNVENPSEKSINKESDTWVDPFSSNGQESCNNTENDVSTTETTTTDLEVFEKVMSAKLDKVYPTSLNVQPLRQISLPDTHIFTPSDSETPRSKTIHYDTVAPVLLNQPVTNVSPSVITADETSPKLEDDDYWEFQDFKSTTENVQPPKEDSNSNTVSDESNAGNSKNLIPTGASYQPQLLQPIKLEPLVPTLNWPDPGEVKETFDDFSDFVSNATWESDKNNTPIIKENKSEEKPIVLNKQNDSSFIETNSNLEVNDDEFETFQSAPTVPQSVNSKPFEDSSQITYQASSSKSNFDNAFSDFGKINQNEITKPHDVFVKNVPHFPTENYNNSMLNVRDSFVNNSPIHSVDTPNILQPVPATSSSRNNTAQILQPLSLESYSQINWPNPGIDLQDLSRFNPVETVPSLKSDISSNSQSKVNSPAHTDKNSVRNEVLDDDIWGEFVSSKPKPSTKKPPIFGDEEEWTEFVSSTSIKPQNGLNTISLNVHTNLSLQKSSNLNKLNVKNNQISLDIPTLNYITPKSSRKTYNDKHFQNL
ncbi:PREDICTED: uncharacterized protein LOC106101124 isoform X2 [Papilio polytes]|uniref:uncharacterized protein LOC106101124 isoform X2 n=1 Tax=Papilio polytes TaxID=76194 RepID=UPI00067614AD|nr:PREDICTED: uncharacterized protein LOC106101124 isoform X2 [Papilio polytes]